MNQQPTLSRLFIENITLFPCEKNPRYGKFNPEFPITDRGWVSPARWSSPYRTRGGEPAERQIKPWHRGPERRSSSVRHILESGDGPPRAYRSPSRVFDEDSPVHGAGHSPVRHLECWTRSTLNRTPGFSDSLGMYSSTQAPSPATSDGERAR